MKTTQRRMTPVDDESETGRLAAVRDVERADADPAEMDRADLDLTEMDRAEAVLGMGRSDGERHDSSSDIESETPVPQGDTVPPGDTIPQGGRVPQGDMSRPPFPAPFGDSKRETPRAEPPHLADQTSTEAGQRWHEILAGFVDDPRKAVGDAHQLVGEVVQRIVDGFARERDNLERQWSRGGDVSTEDLRVALQNYRAFFARLLPSTDR